MNSQLSQEQIKAIQEKLKNMPPEQLKEMMKQQCLFCQISNNKIEAKKVYEDDEVLAVLDINPASKGHTIVFPKEHYQVLAQIPEKLIEKLFNIANKMSSIIFETVQAEGTNIFVANGQAAGQNSPHAIIHIIPRFRDDNLGLIWEPKKGDDNELNELQSIIKNKAYSIEIKKEKPKVVKKQKIKDEKSPPERVP